MKTYLQGISSVVAGAVLVACAATGAVAQGAAPENAPLSYIADPKVYKLLSENDQFRVISVNRPAGHRDAWHSHSPGALYNLTACRTRLYTPDGKSRESINKAGSVVFNPTVASHAAENIGKTACKQIIVERK